MSNQQEMAEMIRPCNTQLPYAFVSYSKKDFDIVYPVVAGLQREGYNIWIDKELTANVGKNWESIALKAITSKKCKAILFFVSENSILSSPVCAEITWAHSKAANRYGQIKIIPICASRTWSPKDMGIYEWIINVLAESVSGEEEITASELDILRLAKVEERYLEGPEQYIIHSDLALHIFEIHFKPNGGNNETFAFVGDKNTIRKNIPHEVHNAEISMEQNISTDEHKNSELTGGLRDSENAEAIEIGSDHYEGQYKDGKRDGEGVFYFKDGRRYEGQFKNDMYEGTGTFYYKDGERYEGQYKDGKKDGEGTYYYKSGDRYEGQFKNGMYEGTGTFYYKSGNRYVGHWKANKKDGEGVFYFKDGRRYEGQFKNDMYEGTGTLYYKSGNRYVGQWKANNRHGQGKEYNSAGELVFEGRFENGDRVGISAEDQ